MYRPDGSSGLDQPNSALDQYGRAAEKFTGETYLAIQLEGFEEGYGTLVHQPI